MTKIWTFLRGILVAIGFSVVLLAFIGAWALKGEERRLPDQIVLTYTFFGSPPDDGGDRSILAQFMPTEPSLMEVTDALYRAAGDKRVSALAVRLAAGNYDWADVQELRAAIAAFRAAGKKTYVYAESYGELYPGMAEYYLASAFEDIWIQPVGTVAITGFQAEVPYFKKTLEMVGVSPDIIQKGDFKTAPESALLEHMSDAQRETLHDILSSMMTDFFEGVSAGRKIPAARIGQLVDAAPYTAEEAKERGLVDHVGYLDQLTDMLMPEDAGDDKSAKGGKAKPSRELVDAVDYLYADKGSPIDKVVRGEEKALKKKDTGDNTVALIYIGGLIVSDSGYDGGGAFGDRMAYASDIAHAIDDATENDDVKAIVLRVTSPGGSPSASETIRRAVEVARSKGKYVVVSMGAEAASGGYWVVVNAERIFAQPGTLTGSIGVFGGKASFAGLWPKLGVNWDSVTLGGNAGLWSPNQPYNAEQRQAISHMLDDVYDGFIDRVAKGRNFAPEVVEAMAQGRVWTGRQAKERGLVDEIGGLRQALEDVAKKIGVADVQDLDVIILPDAPSPIDGLMELVGQNVQAFGPVKDFLHMAIMARHPEWSVVRAPSFEIRH